MSFLLRRGALWIVGGLVAGGCGGPHGDESDLLRAEIPGAIDSRLELGQAYDSDRATWGNVACVTGETMEVAAPEAKLEYARDMSYDSTMHLIAGDIGAGVTFPSVAVEGKAEYASESSATDYRETHSLSFHYEAKRKFKLGSVAVNDVGRRYASDTPALLRDRCKNEFVGEIDLGLSFLATMAVEFQSKADKEKFGGSLKVDVLSGVVHVEGRLAVASEDERKSVRITLRAEQEGGDARQLATILTPSVASCDAANLAPCLEGFGKLIAYGNGLGEQIARGPDLLKTLAYHTESYADTGLETLVPPNGQEVTALTLDTREHLETELQQARGIYARATTLLDYGTLAAGSARDRVTALQMAAFDRRRELTKALMFCYANPYMEGTGSAMHHPCSENARTVDAALPALDLAALELAADGHAEREALCASARAKAKARGALDEPTFQTYERIDFVPEYATPHDPTSEIVGWGDCATLAEQL